MRFEFTKTEDIEVSVWRKCNEKLLEDLNALVAGGVASDEVERYLIDMLAALETVNKEKCDGMLFLMYDRPDSMPADARVEFVYKPTYIAATFMMTAMNRFENIASNQTFVDSLHAVLEATTGRDFRGAGYEEFDGFLETLEIFAMGDTWKFIKKYPMVNNHFVSAMLEAVSFLENEICGGNVKDPWSGEDYSIKGRRVLEMYQERDLSDTEYVWYACYGSNICKERFVRYINACSDTTAPVEDRPYLFAHNIYFAKTARAWHDGGKAFLDDNHPGFAYGRIYKITREQFEEVKNKEGADYRKKICLGKIEGIPVFSFTDTQKNTPTRIPSDEYFSIIMRGLRETYEGILTEEEMVNYLIDSIFPAHVFEVVRAIKENAHYISNNELSTKTGLEIQKVLEATDWLVNHKVIQQDQRSIRAGHQINSLEAFFFTVDNRCARTLVSTILEYLPVRENVIFIGEREGVRHNAVTSRIERSSRNRIEAIRLHGYKCQVCGFDYEKFYGELGRNYIEVHHINPLAEQEEEHVVNPETDLVCLCANCHRMIHRNRNRVLSVEKLKAIIVH